MKVLLWDIDGTLIRSGRAGSKAMSDAARDVFGLPGAFDQLSFAGRTDPWAIETICTRHGIRPVDGEVDRFYATYVAHLRAGLHNPDARICAGVRPLLERFHGDRGYVQALLTGNIREGARAKLEHFGLWHFFHFGAFADDSGDRNALGPVALRRAREHLRRDGLTPRDLVIIGDTPFDIACARACGAHCVVAATGGFTLEQLAPHQPDLLVPDFSDPTPLERFLGDL